MRNRTPITENRATYNVCTGRLKVWLKDKLPREEWERLKASGVSWWPGSQCMTCTWRPWFEDWITEKGIEIEDDDTPDDTEARVERFTGYAENAEKSADAASAYAGSGRANTERRQRFARRREASEVDRAAYWQHRIDRAIAHANFKENPITIAGRIDELERRRRQHVAAFTPREITPGVVYRHQDDAGRVFVVVGPKGRGSHAVEESKLPAIREHETRWIEHIDERLQYERAALAATGHVQAEIASNEAPAIEVGGAVQARAWQCERGEWYQVTKLNPRTIEIYAPGKHFTRPLIDRGQVEHIASKLRVDAGEIPCAKLAIAEPKKGAKSGRAQSQTKDGKTPELFGAYVERGDGDDIKKARLIIRLNGSSVTGLYAREETYSVVGEGGKTTPQTRLYYRTPKDLPSWIAKLWTPAEVKAQAPELLAMYERYKVAKGKHAAAMKKAEAAAIERSKALAPTDANVAAAVGEANRLGLDPIPQ
jgi:hypothetical protein